jgi:hypothetical protein
MMKSITDTGAASAFVRRHSGSGLAVAGGYLLAGCGADDLPPPSATEEGTLEVGHITGSVVGGKLSLQSATLEGAGPPSVAPQGFSAFGSGTISFDTPSDGLGTGSCTATQYCAQVEATNLTGRLMDNMFVEITQYTYVPPDMTVTWAGTPFTASNAYGNFFVNSGDIEAADYGNFTIGQTKNVEWKFDIASAGPPSADFYFDAAVYASFRRTSQAVLSQKTQTATNACTATGGVPTYHNGVDDAETNFELPFPFTLRDITYDRAVVGSNGYLLFYKTGQSAPTAGASSGMTNQSMAAASTVPGYYVFWDDLAFDSGSGVCASVSGAKPNRVFTLTWNNAKINAAQPGKGTWSTQRITYSLMLQERVDTATYAYNLPTGGASPLTRGSSATVGVRAVLNGAAFSSNVVFNNGANAIIPAASTDYAARYRMTQGIANP